MMKIFLILAGWVLSIAVMAGEKIDRTLPAASDGYVQIEHLDGQAVIRGWSKSEVQVRGELGENTEAFIFERSGNEVVIKVEARKSRDREHKRDRGDNLEIFVPEDSRISYTSVNSDVEVEDVQGGVVIETVNGEIDAQSLDGRIRLESVNGDIQAKSLAGEVSIETVNGDIEHNGNTTEPARYTSVNGDLNLNIRSEEVEVETVNGDMQLSLGEVSQLGLQTVNGSIEVRMDLAKDGDVRASSVGGSLDLYFQDSISARFDIQGHAGGRIVNKLSEHKASKAKYGPSRWLEFSLNGGAASVDVSTVSGRVRLDRK